MEQLGRLYVIGDRRAAGRGLVAAVAAVIEALPPGAALVQLREKDLAGRDLLALARQLAALTRAHGAALLVNDRIDVALAAAAEGAHLPAASFDVATARALLGPGRLIGVSTHGIAAAGAAATAGADLIVLGPIWATPSKPDAVPLGLGRLREAVAEVERQSPRARLYALGGIDGPKRAEAARRAGAYGVAAIRAFLAPPDPGAAAVALHRAVSG